MQRKVEIEEIRNFIRIAEKQIAEGGVNIQRVRFKRDEAGHLKDILIDYEEKENNPQK